MRYVNDLSICANHLKSKHFYSQYIRRNLRYQKHKNSVHSKVIHLTL